MKRLAVVLLGLLVSGGAWAENWYDTGKSQDGTLQYFVDLDTIKKAKVRVLSAGDREFLTVVSQPTYLKGNELRKKGSYYQKNQLYISCDDNSYYINAYIVYGNKHEVIESWQNERHISINDFKYAFPNTMIDGVIKTACGYYKGSQFQPPETYLPTEKTVSLSFDEIRDLWTQKCQETYSKFTDFTNCVSKLADE